MDLGDFRGRAKRLDDTDLPRIGHRIGVGEDELHALIDVESGGSGFDRLGRPKMLFEPHVFWRNLRGRQRAAAERQGLAYPKWKRKYPKDSYPRLKRAIAINQRAALKASSWGSFQILGENYAAAGFASPQAMVKAIMDDEENHLLAAVNFIQSNNLDDELRRHDWRGLARGYNGPGYAKNAYHTRLAAAFRKWQHIPDTPWSPGDEPPPKMPAERPKPDPAPQPRPKRKSLLGLIADLLKRLFGKD